MPPTSAPRRHASSPFMVSRVQEFEIEFRFEHIASLEGTIRYLVIGSRTPSASRSRLISERRGGPSLWGGRDQRCPNPRRCVHSQSDSRRALELRIGTGRIALPLARRGVAVHGIDLSRAMVARLRAKPGGVTIGDFATLLRHVRPEGAVWTQMFGSDHCVSSIGGAQGRRGGCRAISDRWRWGARCLLRWHAAEGGADVTFLVRPARAAQLVEHGLVGPTPPQELQPIDTAREQCPITTSSRLATSCSSLG
jgi:hypothetical protein